MTSIPDASAPCSPGPRAAPGAGAAVPSAIPLSDNAVENLLARLAGRGPSVDSSADADPYRAIAATEPDQAAAKAAAQRSRPKRKRREKLGPIAHGRIPHLAGGSAVLAAA